MLWFLTLEEKKVVNHIQHNKNKNKLLRYQLPNIKQNSTHKEQTQVMCVCFLFSFSTSSIIPCYLILVMLFQVCYSISKLWNWRKKWHFFLPSHIHLPSLDTILFQALEHSIPTNMNCWGTTPNKKSPRKC